MTTEWTSVMQNNRSNKQLADVFRALLSAGAVSLTEEWDVEIGRDVQVLHVNSQVVLDGMHGEIVSVTLGDLKGWKKPKTEDDNDGREVSVEEGPGQ